MPKQTAPPKFYAEFKLPLNALEVEVKGIGSLHVNGFTKTVLSKLLNLSSDAKFGLGEKTLLDKDIRNTQEIPAEKIHVAYSGENDHPIRPKRSLPFLFQKLCSYLNSGDRVTSTSGSFLRIDGPRNSIL